MEHELEARFVGQDCQGLGIALQDLPPLEILQAGAQAACLAHRVASVG